MSEPDYDEFDDLERHGPCVSSKKARTEISRLAHFHGLSYTHNPGGGEFSKLGVAIQIHGFDDISDLATLRAAAIPHRRERGRG